MGERSTITGRWRSLVGIPRCSQWSCSRAPLASAATIFVALVGGNTKREAATEFAFLVGIPTMFAATGYELIDVLQSGEAANEDWTAFTVAFIASAVTAFIAVKWLLNYIHNHRFTGFAIYRFVLGAALLLLMPAGS